VKNRTVIIVVGVIVLVVGLAGAAVLLSGGDDEGSVSAPGATSGEASGDLEQTRPVEVIGDPLASLSEVVDADPAIGQAMPVVEGAGFDGQAMSIGGPTDGPTLYVFLAHWCPHCNDEIPELIELDERGGVPDDVDVVAISTAVDPSGPNYPPSQWLVDKTWPAQWPVMADDDASTSFVVNGGGGFPYLMIVDADGNVLDRASGTKSADELDAWLQETLPAPAA
jgi:cytochrome c biogenesis protein CcmG/thiol:disulfide interchange protein DsbE